MQDTEGYWRIGYGQRLNDAPGGPKPAATMSEPFAADMLCEQLTQKSGTQNSDTPGIQIADAGAGSKGPISINERGNPQINFVDRFKGLPDDVRQELNLPPPKSVEVPLPAPVPASADLDQIPITQLQQKRDELQRGLNEANGLSIAGRAMGRLPGLGKVLGYVGQGAGTLSAERLKQHISAYDAAISRRNTENQP